MASSTSFTPQTFAKLSPHPFLLANLHPSSSSAASSSSSSNNNPQNASHQSPPSSRTNGRAPREPRPVQINRSALSHAHGSAMVRVGDTSVLCGVRGEILPVTHIPQWRAPKMTKMGTEEENLAAAGGQTTDNNDNARRRREQEEEGAAEMRDYDLLVPNIELATGCAPSFLPGAPPTTLAQTLSTRVFSLLHGAGLLDVDDLRVWYTPRDVVAATAAAAAAAAAGGGDDEKMADDDDDDDDGEEEEEEEEEAAAAGKEEAMAEPEVKAYWTLYIDVLFLSFDGNPFDAAWAAVLAALRDTKLPRAWWDADREMVLCSRAEGTPLRVTGLPVATTAVVVTEKEAEQGQVPGPGSKGGKGRTWTLVDPDRSEEALCEESITVVVDRSRGETRIRGVAKSGGRVLGPGEVREVVGLAEDRWEEVSQVLLA